MTKKKKSSEKEEFITECPDQLPVLASADLVAFPSVMMSLYIGRPAGIAAIEAARKGEELVFVVAQRDEAVEEPEETDLFQVGVVAQVVKSLKMKDGGCKVLLQGLMRARVKKYKKGKTYFVADLEVLEEERAKKVSETTRKLMDEIRKSLELLVEQEQLPEELLLVTAEIEDPGILADVVLAHYRLATPYAQSALEELKVSTRLKLTITMLQDDINQSMLSENIRSKTADELNKGQREYFLREQIRQIQKELGDNSGLSEDLLSLKNRLEEADLPDHAAEEAMKQFRRLERMQPESSEYALLRTYLEWIGDLPWSISTSDRLGLKQARKILDEDHFSLEKVKERVLEYLSVRKLNPDSRGPILCFVGPPGVGKTSLGKSIARSLNRNFVRIALGGVRDEAEIRGHRRTYVGALPGRLLQGLKQAGSRNPVILLDELDKVSADFRGDPSAALLEVLDPEQNHEFRDHYLGIPFDLSSAIFIATANTIDTIPGPLLDRLELISIPGYTTQEKMKIARNYLVPRQLKEKGMNRQKIHVSDEAIEFLVERYTRESGVRNLEREVASLCRKLAREYAEHGKVQKKITPEIVEELLGNTKYDPDPDDSQSLVGLARGLAWTVHGGELLPIEASVARGSGKLMLTGQLGDVMQESAQAALFYARANAEVLGLDPEFYEKYDIHVHVPGGATPKDGPSAGITIATALVSALSGRKISNKYAMTGEITLRGNVMRIGGLKEKALAALRYGIRNVIIPAENKKDLSEIPEEQRKKIKFIPVEHVGEVLELAILKSVTRKPSGTIVKAKTKKKQGKSKPGKSSRKSL